MDKTKSYLLLDSIKPSKSGCRRGAASSIFDDIDEELNIQSGGILKSSGFHEKYTVVKGSEGILGEGLNGAVRLATHKFTEEEVAVKRVDTEDMSQRRKYMLLSEIQIFMQLDHENIVKLKEVYVSEEEHYIIFVMMVCRGKELFERLAEKTVYKERDTVRVVKQMFQAIHYLHGRSICHRDLKLENWLYETADENSKLKLCDFGFGEIVDPAMQLTATLGSLYYVAPEVLAGRYGLACDIWSLGVIVYMLLSGKAPCNGANNQEIIRNIKKGEIHMSGRRWENISEAAKHFISSLLRRDPTERMTAREALMHRWLLQSTPINKNILNISNDDQHLEEVQKDMQQRVVVSKLSRLVAAYLTKMERNRECELWLPDVEEETIRNELNSENELENINDSFYSSDVTISYDFKLLLSQLIEVDVLRNGFLNIKTFMSVLHNWLPKSLKLELPTALKSIDMDIDYVIFIKALKALMQSRTLKVLCRTLESRQNYFHEVFTAKEIIDSVKGTCDLAQLETLLSRCTCTESGKESYIDTAALIREIDSELERSLKFSERCDISCDFTDMIETLDKRIQSDVSYPEVENENKAIDQKKEGGVNRVVSLPSDGYSITQHAKFYKRILRPFYRNQSVSNIMLGLIAGTNLYARLAVKSHVADVIKTSRGWFFILPNPKFHSTIFSRNEYAEKLQELYKSNKKCSMCGEPMPDTGEDISEFSDDKTSFNLRTESLDDRSKLLSDIAFSPTINKDNILNLDFSDILSGDITDKTIDSQGVIQRCSNSRIDLCNNIEPYLDTFSKLNSPTNLDDISKIDNEKVSDQLKSTISFKKNERISKEKNLLPENSGKNLTQSLICCKNQSSQMNELSNTSLQKIYRSKSQPNSPLFCNNSSLRCKSTPHILLPEESSAKSVFSTPEPSKTRHHIKNLCEGCNASLLYLPQEPDPNNKEDIEFKDYVSERTIPDISKPARRLSNTCSGLRTDKDIVKFRFVVWWIHPQFIPQVCHWMGYLRAQGQDDEQPALLGLGSPGDFAFSEIPKPHKYLHTYRDLSSTEDLQVLEQLKKGVRSYLSKLFSPKFLNISRIEAGFHYPVRSQYSTLHMQMRINSGIICKSDGRGIDLSSVIDALRTDPRTFSDDTLISCFTVTENIKVSLLAATKMYEEASGLYVHQKSGMLSYELFGEAVRGDSTDEED